MAVKHFYEILVKGHTHRLFEQELSICCRVRHPNIVPVYGFAMEKDRPLHMIMELLEGSLEDLIVAARSSGHYLSECEQVDVAVDCVSGIQYLHGLHPRPHVHGDVKMSNMMITQDMRAKVGDLGACHILSGSLSAGPVAPNYVAPERLTQIGAHCGLACDVFSLGVTLCEVFIGEAAVASVRRDQLDAIEDPDLKDLCLQMCSEQPENRPTACQVLGTLLERGNGDKYKACPPRRIVVGKSERDDVRLVDWAQ